MIRKCESQTKLHVWHMRCTDAPSVENNCFDDKLNHGSLSVCEEAKNLESFSKLLSQSPQFDSTQKMINCLEKRFSPPHPYKKAPPFAYYSPHNTNLIPSNNIAFAKKSTKD